jgi:CDP-glycerol glycerophosphotransferase
VPPRYGAFVRNASSVHDVSELLAVTDLLVTDYSSVMFDFAVTRRPMVFFTYDYDDYVGATRGTYFELADVAPGPLVATQTPTRPVLRA